MCEKNKKLRQLEKLVSELYSCAVNIFFNAFLILQ